MTFIQTLLSRASPSTVVTTAARGRGKSAALGLGLACAVALGSEFSLASKTFKIKTNLNVAHSDMFSGFL